MSKVDFSIPQRESKAGILLIFATAVFQIIRNFWFLGVYLLVQDVSPRTWLFLILGLASLLILTLIYSILYYLRFLFFIDQEKQEFVLQKGVFSSDVISVPFDKIQQVHFKRSILQRIIGVNSLLIDTAGSKEKEVEIKALTKDQADSLAELLMELSAKQKPELESHNEGMSEGDDNSELYWDFRLKTSTLLKLGLTSNYLRGLGILVVFYVSLKEQLSHEVSLQVPEFAFVEFLSTPLLFLLLFLVGMLVTVVQVFIKYYNLQVSSTKAGLKVEMGLKENTVVSILPRRVQLLRIGTNPLQKWLDLYRITISLASSQDDLTKDEIQIPGLPKRVVDQIDGYLSSSDRVEIYKLLPHRLVLLRRMVWVFAPLLAAGAFFFWGWIPATSNWMLWLVIPYLFLMTWFQVAFYKSLKLSVSRDFLVKESGVWIREQQIIETYKLQGVTISEPLWYKKRKLVKLHFHTAGGDVSYALIKKEEALPLLNFLIYIIEVTSKRWM